MENVLSYAVFFLLFLVLLGLGLPVAFVLGATSVVGILFSLDPGVLFKIAQDALQCGSDFVFIMIPLFILMAEVIPASGLGEETFTAAQKWFNRLPGGLAISSIGSCACFASISGSSPVTAAAIGAVAVPEMINRGYDRKLAAGAVAAGGTLGIMIPPSLAMVLYGVITQTSIGALFMAGIVPGIVLTIILSLMVIGLVKIAHASAPSMTQVGWREKFAALKHVWPVALLALVVLGSIYTGVATPTEASAMGATGAIIIVLCLRRITVSSLYKTLVRTATTTCMMILLIIGGSSLSFFVSTMGIPRQITDFLVSASMSPWIFMIVLNIIYLILGCLLDPMSILVITLPILFPVVSGMGFDPVWFGIVVTLNIEIGMITPPVGMNLFILRAVLPQLELKEIVVGSLPFVGVLIAGLAVLMLFPGLALWLPSMMR